MKENETMAIEKNSGGDKIVVSIDGDLEEIIPLYFSNSREEIGALRESLRKEDYEDLVRLGHGIKGSSAGYGFEAMGAMGAQIEDAARQRRSFEEIRTLIESLEDYLDRVEVVYV